MIPYFPKQISFRAVIVYAIALVSISLLFFGFVMRTEFIILGIISVFGFFYFANLWSQSVFRQKERVFVRNLFLIALLLRIAWVIISYFYYSRVNGNPFEFGAADAIGYHEGATWVSSLGWIEILTHYFGNWSYISDSGYPFYLTVIYKIFGPNILFVRLLKAIIGAATCVLIYNISKRTFNDEIGRLAAIMFALMPNLIIYCGYHLKETEMLFLEVAFLERTDFLLRSRKITFWNILLPTILAGCLFFFRTVMGAAAIFAFATSVLLSTTPTMKTGWRRTAIIAWGVLCLFVVGGGTFVTEIEGLWEDRDANLANKRLEQSIRGNQWAKYATGTVMAPMVFVLPFSTMVDVDEQYGQQEKHSGNYIRNFMGFFTAIAIYEAIRRKKWRDFSLIGSFVIAYLGVVSLSGFSNSERFLLPGLPCLIMMWAYGVATLRKQTYNYLTPWCIIVCVMEIGWAYFKLGSRGIF